MHMKHIGDKMKATYEEIQLLEKKLFLAERRYRIEQKNIWLYKKILSKLGEKPKPKVVQLDMFSA